MEPRGRGSAEQRTQLAWGRNGLALVACGLALLKRVGPLAASGDRPVLGVMVVTMGSAVWVMSAVYRRRRAAGQLADPASMRLVAYSTAAIGSIAVVIALTPG